MNRFQFDCINFSKWTGDRWWPVCLVLIIGCGNSGNPHPVRVELAQQTLASTMQSWKDGKTPDDLRKGKPSVVIQDFDWSAGVKLLDYELVGDGRPVDANLYAKVKLKLSREDGKETEKTVTYIVTTAPALTVFRDMLH